MDYLSHSFYICIILSVVVVFTILYNNLKTNKQKYRLPDNIRNADSLFKIRYHNCTFSSNSTENYTELRDNYIQVLENILLNSVYEDGPWIDTGNEWPPGHATTMIGRVRMRNVRELVIDVIKNKIPGDVLEAGSWRGGAMMYARAILNAYSQKDRKVYVCDSFQGIPRDKRSKFQQDRIAHKLTILNQNSVESVKKTFESLNLLNNVEFVVGFFSVTLPTLKVDRIAVLRLDGDTYHSTMDSLTNLYPKLSIGGFIIIDDYPGWEGCKAAVDEYRKKFNIVDPIHKVNHAPFEYNIGVWWQKTKK